VKTHTGKTSSLPPVGCISDQFPTRGTPTTSLRLARLVCLRLAHGPRRTAKPTARAPPPTRVEERFPTPCKCNSWRPCRQLTPTRALMLV
jgi:hypothetical protein